MNDRCPTGQPNTPTKEDTLPLIHTPESLKQPVNPQSSNTNDHDMKVSTMTTKTQHSSSNPTATSFPSTHNPLAWISMVLLVLQGTAMSVVLRYSRIVTTSDQSHYLASVSVCMAETIKLVICASVQATKTYLASRRAAASKLPISTPPDGLATRGSTATARGADTGIAWRAWVSKSVKDASPMALPAGMFTFQQVLLIVAATYLDAVTYQIFNQAFKLVPTAIFARVLLGQLLTTMQWASMPVLAAGVVLVTINNNSGGGGGGGGSGSSSTSGVGAAAATASADGGQIASTADWMFGMVSCSIAGLSSAYAGVYFEKYVKGKHAASLWVRNIQLGMFGVPFSLGYALVRDGDVIRAKGMFTGFTSSAWVVVALQVFGGLVIGLTVKYTSSVLKNFALAISVILTVLVAIPLFHQWPSAFFLVGVSLVLTSVFMYSNPSLASFSFAWASNAHFRPKHAFVELWDKMPRRRRRWVVVSASGVGTVLVIMMWMRLLMRIRKPVEDTLQHNLLPWQEEGWDGGL
jgi:solute carrier family 35 (UDP-sugar transporter), member A1/2/3